MEGNVWVYLEIEGGQLSSKTISAVGCAQDISKSLGKPLEAVVVSSGSDQLLRLPEQIKRIYRLEGMHNGHYPFEVLSETLKGAVDEARPRVFVLPDTTQGQDLCSWLGCVMGCGAVVSADFIEVKESAIVASRKEYDGKIAVDYELKGPMAFLTARDGAFEMDGKLVHGGCEVKVVGVKQPSSPCVQVLETKVSERTVNIKDARVIVAVGAGVSDEQTMDLARRLAQALGAELGCTRAAVDSGFMPHDRQIGQTGERVKPDLYIACGISGAIQHRVGMIDSGVIVSINVDPQAPIFRYSHYCVEGDLREVLPKLIGLLNR